MFNHGFELQIILNQLLGQICYIFPSLTKRCLSQTIKLTFMIFHVLRILIRHKLLFGACAYGSLLLALDHMGFYRLIHEMSLTIMVCIIFRSGMSDWSSVFAYSNAYFIAVLVHCMYKGRRSACGPTIRDHM